MPALDLVAWQQRKLSLTDGTISSISIHLTGAMFTVRDAPRILRALRVLPMCPERSRRLTRFTEPQIRLRAFTGFSVCQMVHGRTTREFANTWTRPRKSFGLIMDQETFLSMSSAQMLW